jgi:hypothetical protein
MHQAQQEYYGSNVNQYATQQQYAGGYYYPPPNQSQSQQQHDVHSHNDMPNHYWYRNPYYHSSYHDVQGFAHAQVYAQAQAANPVQPQPHHRNRTTTTQFKFKVKEILVITAHLVLVPPTLRWRLSKRVRRNPTPEPELDWILCKFTGEDCLSHLG